MVGAQYELRELAGNSNTVCYELQYIPERENGFESQDEVATGKKSKEGQSSPDIPLR